MAERQRDKSDQKTRRNGSGPTAPAEDLTQAAREIIEDLTGYPAEAVTGLHRDGESWLVTVEVLELERVPSTTDVLATYAVQLNDESELLGYERRRRFLRAQTEEEG